jgi:hypothetical protein
MGTSSSRYTRPPSSSLGSMPTECRRLLRGQKCGQSRTTTALAAHGQRPIAYLPPQKQSTGARTRAQRCAHAFSPSARCALWSAPAMTHIQSLRLAHASISNAQEGHAPRTRERRAAAATVCRLPLRCSALVCCDGIGAPNICTQCSHSTGE